MTQNDDRIADAIRARESLEHENGDLDLLAEGLGAGRLPGEAQIAAEKLDSDDDVTDETTTD
ncbi:MAG: hypothetical protein AB7K08_08810 [Microbacteriaceae bacterium]